MLHRKCRAIQEQCQISQDRGLFDNADNDNTRPGRHEEERVGGGSVLFKQSGLSMIPVSCRRSDNEFS